MICTRTVWILQSKVSGEFLDSEGYEVEDYFDAAHYSSQKWADASRNDCDEPETWRILEVSEQATIPDDQGKP